MSAIIAQLEASVEFLINTLGYNHPETVDAINQLARIKN